METTTLNMRLAQSFSQDILETVMIDFKIPDFIQFRKLEDQDLLQRCNAFFERSGAHSLVHSLRGVVERSKADSTFILSSLFLTTRSDKPMNDKFINRWKWILETFTWVSEWVSG